MAAAPSNNDILFPILRCLDDRNLTDTARALERESGVHFNMNHFEDLILSDKLNDADSTMQKIISKASPHSTTTWNRQESTSCSGISSSSKLSDGSKRHAQDIAENELCSFEMYYPQIYERAREFSSDQRPELST